jgi:hypothetical protein
LAEHVVQHEGLEDVSRAPSRMASTAVSTSATAVTITMAWFG